MTETEKYRDLTTPHCQGNGIDVGSGGDPVVPWAIQHELSREKDYGGRQMPPGIEWVGNDAARLPYRDGALDFVYSSHLLEDYADWRPLLAEWTRVLKSGGKLVILIPDKARWMAALAAGQPPNDAHQHEGYAGELSTYADEFGLDVIEDRLTDQDARDYSILFVARKRFVAPAAFTEPKANRPAVTIGHSGDLGDILAHLPAMRQLCGPDRQAEIVLYRAEGVREPFDLARAYNVGNFLAEQPWVRRWRFWEWPLNRKEVDHDFGDWRSWYTHRTDGRENLAKSACEFFRVDPAACDVPWLTTREALPVTFNVRGRETPFPVVVFRSHRYRDPSFPWEALAERFGNRAFCVGPKSEYDELAEYGFKAHVRTPTLAELAQVIAGAEVVIGNQTCPFWIAEGLKKTVLLERCPRVPNCDFDRPGLIADRHAVLAFADAYKSPGDAPAPVTAAPRIRGVGAAA